MICHEHKFIFVHINKTAGTSVEKVFVKNADKKDIANKHKPILFYKTNYPDEFAEYFKFSFVRNPWDWAVSRYFWSRDKQKLFDYDFKEFIRRLELEENLSTRVNWIPWAMRPQSDRLYLEGVLAVDFVGRFEKLQSDFNEVCDALSIRRTEMPHVFKTRHKPFHEYYDDETRNSVARLYKRDIELFGYTFK